VRKKRRLALGEGERERERERENPEGRKPAEKSARYILVYSVRRRKDFRERLARL